VLPVAALVTLRAGELARDGVRDSFFPLPEEVIKIAGGSGWSCPLFRAGRAGGNVCSVYPRRPAQCRAFFCGDPSALAAMYEQDRLRRADLFPLLRIPGSESWPALVEAYEAECAWERLIPLIRRARRDPGAGRSVREAVCFDVEFRRLAVERAAVPREALPLLFGRLPAEVLRLRAVPCF
jgi:Fe-S-cluster containining protein